MCARYNLQLTPDELAAVFDLLRVPDFEPRYNVAPTQSMPIIRDSRSLGSGADGRLATIARWGLVPSWSREPKTKFPLVNARSETVATAPSFRAPFKRQRCLVPATGYYEWTGPKKHKQPHHIGLADASPFAFAGLWDRWGDDLESFTILTCESNALMAPLHDRMPVLLAREDWSTWLDRDIDDRNLLESLLVPYEPDEMSEYASNPIVNSVRNESPECIQPVADPAIET